MAEVTVGTGGGGGGGARGRKGGGCSLGCFVNPWFILFLLLVIFYVSYESYRTRADLDVVRRAQLGEPSVLELTQEAKGNVDRAYSYATNRQWEDARSELARAQQSVERLDRTVRRNQKEQINMPSLWSLLVGGAQRLWDFLNELAGNVRGGKPR